MTYAGCPKCYAKTGEAVTIMKQTTCSNPRCEKTVVPLTYFYFFRCIIQDNSGQIEVGFARDFAQNLLNGIEPVKFRQMFAVYNPTYQVQFNEYCSKNVYNRPLKAIIKKRTEMFQGQQVERFYAFGCQYIGESQH